MTVFSIYREEGIKVAIEGIVTAYSKYFEVIKGEDNYKIKRNEVNIERANKEVWDIYIDYKM